MRLLILAEHLSDKNINPEFNGIHFFYSDDASRLLIGREGKYHCLFPQLVSEIPKVFSEFERTTDGRIVYRYERAEVVYYTLMKFFGLELHEFLYLFTASRQNIKIKNKVMIVDYKTEVIAANMYKFLKQELKKRKQN